MKKLLFILSLVLIYSCNMPCTIAQVSDQVVYADIYCRAQLPNYAATAKVAGGCTGYKVTQTPNPGTVLSIDNPVILVTLTAVGTNGKSSQETFTATLADTVTPRITGLTVAQLTDTLLKKSNRLYDIADSMVGKIDELMINTFPYDSFPGMVKEYSYRDKMLIIASSDSAGQRKRYFTYADTMRTIW